MRKADREREAREKKAHAVNASSLSAKAGRTSTANASSQLGQQEACSQSALKAAVTVAPVLESGLDSKPIVVSSEAGQTSSLDSLDCDLREFLALDAEQFPEVCKGDWDVSRFCPEASWADPSSGNEPSQVGAQVQSFDGPCLIDGVWQKKDKAKVFCAGRICFPLVCNLRKCENS